MSLEEKLTEAKRLAEEPVDLSDPEREILENIVTLLKEVLDQVLEDALAKTRDEAFKLVDSYTLAIESAGRMGADKPHLRPEKLETQQEKKPAKPVVYPKLEEIFAELPDEVIEKARRHLECMKSHRALEEQGEDGDQILCLECTSERMINCIRAADPSIVDELDEELRQAGVVR